MTDKSGCVDAESIAAALELDASHPLRAHIDSCSECSALARLYLAFVDQEPVGDDDGSSARRELSKTVAALAKQAESARGAGKSGAGSRLRPQGLPWNFLRGWRPLAAAAALVFGAVAVWFSLDNSPSFDETTPAGGSLRAPVESADAPQPYPATVVAATKSGEADRVHFSWRPVVGADGYRVEVRALSLEVLVLSNTVSDTTYVFPEGAIPAGDSRSFFWRVILMRGDDQTTRSRAMRFDWPAQSVSE